MVRQTRASAAALASTNEPQQLSSPPDTPATTTRAPARRGKQTSPKKVKKEPKEAPSLATPTTPHKRARAADEDDDDKVLDELPHNLGAVATPDASDEAEAVKSETSPPPKKRARGPAKAPAKSPKVKSETKESKVKAEAKSPKVKAEAKSPKVKAETKSPKVKAETKSPKVKTETKSPKAKADATATPDAATPGKAAKAKKNKYGFMPGQTPYPQYARPTSEECHEVTRILSKAHGKVQAPKTIPVPSVEVAGCGEVPSVLDALIRTRLSAATSGRNSSSAFQGLVKRFGTIKSGVGKGSVNWNAVRLASQPEVFEAIKTGGLAQVKSKDIKAILEMTYQENQARKAALTSSTAPDPAGAETEPQETKDQEIEQAESEVLSLDYMHTMETQDAIDHMVRYPGIGAKTASCVALFCLQRPSFAVDTHVFRLVQYLRWVPGPEDVEKGQPKVVRDTAYTHCEARVPDELKYPLHQLLIKHGKACPRCRAATTTSSEGWNEGCPIEHLVKRFEAKKGGTVGDASPGGEERGKAAKGPAKKRKGKAVVSDDEESVIAGSLSSESGGEDEIMSGLGSDGEEEVSELSEDDYED